MCVCVCVCRTVEIARVVIVDLLFDDINDGERHVDGTEWVSGYFLIHFSFLTFELLANHHYIILIFGRNDWLDIRDVRKSGGIHPG